MDLHFIWKGIVIVFGGVLILRLAGRKSISQMTVAQTVMMIAVGSLIIQPVGDRNIWITMIITLILVMTLLLIEFIAIKNDALESFFYSKPIIVIENGQIHEENLKRLRLTVDMLEVRMRQQSIQKISDVQWATIEPNGQLGFLLKPEKQPATKEDIQMLLSILKGSRTNQSLINSSESRNLFTEVVHKKHEKQPPEHLN
ncbi:uncharacterized membrane protein YcaP (DUF421 family) [Evansella vedderi]|uniref:Uncharacterized membrane protein YcaP (DUF421 family) n=1 Tax=Evansella vedderi TaxID=38282 RepID=A0ABT9ZU18_9BACI|nr:DUF421 domain-containing protein [Evansella vedderi]MDQ0254737.1 uncharacterized membrane protein YcaP (DUF421 family) [Evansella vedderi]